jgi:transposase-like protein
MYLTLDEDLTVIEISRDDGLADRDTSDGVSISTPSVGFRNNSSLHDKESVDGLALPETEECLQELRRHRWPNGIICPHCDSSDTIKKGTTSKDAQRYKCHSCGRKFNDLTGTLFGGHRLSLPEMFHIIREMDDTETAQIARRLGRSYKAVLEFVHETRDIRTRDTASMGIAAVL